MPTGFLWHELFAWHDAGRYLQSQIEPAGAADTPEGKRRIRNLIDVSGLLSSLVAVSFEEASDEQLLKVHDDAYLARLKQIDEVGGNVGRYAHIGANGLKIVRLAAGAATAAVDAIMAGKIDNAYALVRPAGHHATSNIGQGFCIINNVAVAARHAQSTHRLERIAIVDWDVHHGNGTQEIFWEDPTVLAISLHQEMLFAGGSGRTDEVGAGKGCGATLNVPLPPGSGNGAYLTAFEKIVIPALEKFRPSMIIVASGLDASSHDSLGRMNLHSDSYRAMTAMLMKAAEDLCGGRLLLVHEGGYSPTLTPFIGLAIVETLAGIKTDISDPFLENVKRQPAQDLQSNQADYINRAAANLALVPAPA